MNQKMQSFFYKEDWRAHGEFERPYVNDFASSLQEMSPVLVAFHQAVENLADNRLTHKLLASDVLETGLLLFDTFWLLSASSIGQEPASFVNYIRY